MTPTAHKKKKTYAGIAKIEYNIATPSIAILSLSPSLQYGFGAIAPFEAKKTRK
jgi:hypothetical protein